MLIPQQLNRPAKRYEAVHTSEAVISAPQAVLSAKPTLYAPPKLSASTNATTTQSMDFMALQSEVEKKLKKLKNEKVSAELAISQGLNQFLLKLYEFLRL